MILLRNMFSMSAMRIVSAGLTLSLVVAFSRIGGIAQLGHFSLLVTIFLFFQLLPLLGLHLYLIREISASPKTIAHHLPNAGLLALCAATLMALGLGFGGSALYADISGIHAALWLVAISLIPTAPIAVIEAGLLAQQRMDFVAKINISENILRTLISLVLVWYGYGLTWVFAVFLGGRVIAAIAYMVSGALPSLFAFKEISARTLRTYVQHTPTFFGIALLGALSTRLDVFAISKLGTAEQLGLYAAAYKLYELGLMVPQIITVVLYPRLCALFVDSREAVSRLLAKGILYPILLAAPVLILIGFNGDWILRLFGIDAGVGSGILAFLLAALIGAGVNQLLAAAMLVLGRSDLDLRTLAIGSVLTAGLLIVTIPAYGALGAAMVMLAMSILLPLLRCVFLAPRLPLAPVYKAILRAVAPAAAMFLVMLFLWASFPVVAVAAGLSIYLLVARQLGLLSLEELREMSSPQPAPKGDA